MTLKKNLAGQLKRFFSFFPVSAAVSLVLALIVGVTGSLIYINRKSDETDRIVNIGLTGSLDDTYMDLAINSLTTLDSTRNSVKLVKLGADEADRALRTGEVGAYVVFPENFIKEAIDGNFQKISIVTADGSKSFSSKILNELIRSVAEMVISFQKAVYGYQQAVYDYGYSTEEMYSLGSNMAFRIIDAVLERDGMYRIQAAEPYGEGSLAGDTASGVIPGVTAVFIMLWGIVSCGAFISRRDGLAKVMASKGNGAARQTAAEYAAYLVFMLSQILILGLAFCAVFSLTPLRQVTGPVPFSFIASLILPVIMISSLQFLIYEASGGILGGVLIHFILGCGMGYVCGCFYPAYFFPRQIQQIARWLPLWQARVHINEVLLSGPVSPLPCVIMLLFAAVFLLAAAAVRRGRIKAEGGLS